MAKKFLDKCRAQGIEITVTCTYRDFQEQNRLYARGRTVLTEHGQRVRKVTNAKAGQSFHNFRLAFDVVPLRHGKPVWRTDGADAMLWQRIGNIGEEVGLEWAGRWKKFREYPHFQYTGGHPLSHFQAGGKL